MIAFANILFCGPAPHPCNARCPFCIGKQIAPQRYHPNLDEYPPRGLDAFLAALREKHVRQIVLTGTNTDPLCYRHLDRLLSYLRVQVPEGRFSLHTNGRLVERHIALVNRFDKVCISLPSFKPTTYRAMMGVTGVPRLPAILARCTVRVKLSCIVTEQNAPEMESYLATCHRMGVRRVVLRKPFGEKFAAQAQLASLLGHPTGHFYSCMVYAFKGMEVTLWDFVHTDIESINLFSTGEVSSNYCLAA
ncbi:MAG: radical SAM protein [Chloroflexota bacterium]